MTFVLLNIIIGNIFSREKYLNIFRGMLMHMSCVAQRKKLLLDFCIDALTTPKNQTYYKESYKTTRFLTLFFSVKKGKEERWLEELI